MNILIIGAGYLGLHAAHHFKATSRTVAVTTRNPDKAKELANEFNDVILWNKNNYNKAFDHKDIVLFTAAPSKSTESDYLETYLENAKRIARHAPKLKQILYTSSTSVYGDLQGGNAFEDTPCMPSSRFGEILLETEKVLLNTGKANIFRLGEIIGPGRTIEDKIRGRKNAPFPGTGNNITNLSPLSTILKALEFAIQKPLFGLYNLTSDQHVTRKELYNQVCREMNLPFAQFDPSLFSHQLGNKIVVSDKLKREGFTFD